jgi:DNA-binding NarL/FixJ family response regulator
VSTVDDIRILIADDHPLFRRGLRSLLDAHAGVTVVAEAATGVEAVAHARAAQPDVAVLDLHMPELDGVEATRRIVGTSPHVAVLVLTMFDDDDSVFAAMRAGARGYLLKGADQSEILRAIEAVSRGEAIFGPTVAQRIIEFFAAPRHGRIEHVFPELTEREHEVLDLIAAGRSNTDIGRQLVLSPKTVRNHVSNIFTKLQVADRAQAIVRAREAGLGR